MASIFALKSQDEKLYRKYQDIQEGRQNIQFKKLDDQIG